MARRERPLDPTTGPLPRFAHGLRELRVAAGNPTYRSMARLAGFSATTLSEAAAGTRRPSLDVVLAYVGACGGDAAEWRARWQQLDAVLRESEASARMAEDAATDQPEPSGRTAATAGADGAEPSADLGRARRRQLVMAAATAMVLAAGVAVAAAVAATGGTSAEAGRHPSAGSTTAPAARPDCLPAGAGPAVFTGSTYAGTTRIRAAVTLNAPLVATVPAGCQLAFTGFCLGAMVFDMTAGSPDVRWFMVSGGGVVASGVVHGNPPPEAVPSPCPGGRPAPTDIRLRATRQGSEWRLRATGTHVDIVGFAARYPADPALPDRVTWHQIAMTERSGGTFETPWQPDRLPAPLPTGTPVLLAAVACLGGDGPTQVLDLGRTTGGQFTGLAPATLGVEDRTAAARAACRYPDG
ncbi:helix-turn-helix domain-containing protein [Micromonospora sp. MS34]|uniref:helix-turn-helix domain-containing protein n=1 Tax=Micromonospora sp. MS34 TaxID=3385971 RepID=UPI00399F7444